MKYENKLLTILLSVISFFLVLIIISLFLFYLKIYNAFFYFSFGVLYICFTFLGPLFISLIFGLIYYTVKAFKIIKGLHVRHEGRLRAISLTTWDICSDKVNLHTLNLSKNRVLDFSKMSGDISRIEALIINYSPILSHVEPSQIAHLDKLTSLRLLEIKDCEVAKISDLGGLEKLTELEALKFAGNNIREIIELESFSKLRVLALNRNKIKKIEGLEKLAKVEELLLSHNRLTEIEGLDKLKNLKSLDLSHNEFTQIRGLESLKNVETLLLNNNKISNIKSLSNLTNLRTLNLSFNTITEIKNLENLENLESLDLNSNKINQVKGLSSLKKLRWLSFHNNPIYSWVKKSFGTNNPQDLVTYCWRNEKAREEAIEYIKKLPSIYEDITFNELESKTKLETKELRPIVEDLIYAAQIKAKITGDSIFFGKAIKVLTSSSNFKKIPQISSQNSFAKKNTSGTQLNVFLSYSTLDSPYFQISDIAKALESYPEINKILYWEADSSENIVEYMERTLQDCSVFILFCSENALNSQAVTDEWQAAFQLRKKRHLKIVPVYENERFVPALLTPLLNVKFSKEDIIGFIIKLYQEVLRE